MTDAQVWWASDRVGRTAFEARAERLVGSVLAHVRYFDMDANEGVRVVPQGEEWLDPPWRNQDHDLLDWGLELDTRDGRTFAVSWYVNPFEGIDVDEGGLFETSPWPTTSVAIWDVTTTEAWSDYVGRPVTRVRVCWERMERNAFSCHALVLDFGSAMVVVGGEGDNIGVTFGTDAACARAVGLYSPRQMHFEPRFRERVARWFGPT